METKDILFFTAAIDVFEIPAVCANVTELHA